jgi:hypothetical protein
MLYSYSFEQNPDWTREYPGQEEILDYLRNVAQKYQLYKYMRFNTSVEAATWDDSKNRWKVDVQVTGGKDAEYNPAYSIECDFLVSAVGQLNQPRYPDIEGLEDFKGKIMHSARWDWSYSLEDKKVGVIGNGRYLHVVKKNDTDADVHRCHCCPDNPGNPSIDQRCDHISTFAQLDHPTRRRCCQLLAPCDLTISTSRPMAYPFRDDGLP